MLTYSDIRNALTGSFLLAKRDATGQQYFDVSIDGFWRSFLMIVPIAPLHILYAMQQVQLDHEMNNQGPFLVTNVGFFVARIALQTLEWLAFPVAMIFIARLLALWPKYVSYIAIYNWSSLFIALILAPSALLYLSGMISAQMTATINLFTIVFALYYRWYIAKIVLETATLTAALIVFFDLILSLLVQGLFSRLTGY